MLSSAYVSLHTKSDDERDKYIFFRKIDFVKIQLRLYDLLKKRNKIDVKNKPFRYFFHIIP